MNYMFDFLEPYLATLQHTDADLIPELQKVTRLDPSNLPRPNDRFNVHKELDQRANACIESMDSLLATLSPLLALRQDHIETVLKEPRMTALVEVGFERFNWVLAAAGGGSVQDVKTLTDYMNLSAQWSALNVYRELIAVRSSDVPIGIANNATMEAGRRLLTTEIRYSWVSELILRSAAQVVTSSDRYQELQLIKESTFIEFFRVFRLFFKTAKYPFEIWRQEASVDAKATASNFSMPAGALAGKTCAALVLTLDYERYPFISFDNESLPISVKQIAFSLEQAFFEYARRVLSDGKARADLFELVIDRTLNRVLPNDIEVLSQPLAVASLTTQDEGEVDFAVLGRGAASYIVFGEAKSCFPSSRVDVVVEAFGSDMRKAALQIRRRLAYFLAGSPFKTSSSAYTMQDEYELFGLVVPLHNYATAIYNKDTLNSVNADDAETSIIPIHQLVMVMQAMKNADELYSYLILRQKMIASRMRIMDEGDILVTHLSGNGNRVLSSALESSLRSEVSALRGFSVDIETALRTQIPFSRADWRKKFYKSAK